MQGDDGNLQKLAELISAHVPKSQQGEATSSEAAFRLPREDASRSAAGFMYSLHGTYGVTLLILEEHASVARGKLVACRLSAAYSSGGHLESQVSMLNDGSSLQPLQVSRFCKLTRPRAIGWVCKSSASFRR